MKFISGRSSVAFTYWVGCFGFNLLCGGLWRLLNYGWLTASDPATLDLLDALATVVAVTSTVLGWGLLRVLWRAAHNNRRPGVWGWIGLVVFALGNVYGTWISATFVVPHLPVPLILAEVEVRNLNKQLPQQIEEGVTLRRVSIEGRTIVYSIRVNETLDSETRTWIAALMSMDAPENQRLCQDMAGYFRGGLRDISYSYAYDNETVDSHLSASKCLYWLKTHAD